MKKAAAFCLLASTALSAHAGDSIDIGPNTTSPGNSAPRAVQVEAASSASGAIGFSAGSFPVDQSAGSVIVTVVRRTSKKGAISATYSTANVTAVDGTNYTAESGTLSWADGDGSSKSFSIPINSSNVFTGTKRFQVRLAAGTNTTLGSHPNTGVVITGGPATPPPPPPPGFVTFPDNLPQAGSQGTDAIPAGAGLEDTSHPDHVIGTGTPASCTSAALVAAVKAGGIITFECGSAPVTIQMTATAQIYNNAASKTVIDGGGLVTLNGMKQRRILYMNTCDQNLVWTTPHCDNQEYPQLTVQNLTFTGGNASTEAAPSGGAIYASGGRLKVVNSRFFSNVCASTGPDTAGAGVYSLEQYEGLPLYVVHSTFGGESTLSNVCSNGGAVGSIGVSWTIINSVMTYNHAVGNGGNPATSGTPGGGSGGAIYNDGNTMVLTVNGSQLEFNTVNAFGSGIFFVTDNHTGSVVITDSTIKGNTGGSWYEKYPQISAFPDTPITVKNSTISN